MIRGVERPGTQLRLDGMPRRLFPCTPSRLTTFSDCPRRYRMTYLDRPPPPKGGPWAHSSLGASVHNALRAWWDEPLARRTSPRAGRLLELGWIQEGFRDAEQSARWRGVARQWVQRYTDDLDPAAEPRGTERHVAAPTGRLAVSGRVDRLDERDGELVVVDYKTGRYQPGPDDARGSLALALYAVASARTLRRPCRLVELHHLPSGRVVAWRHTDEGLDRHVRRAEAIAADIADATAALADGTPADDAFPVTPGPQCSWCDLRRSCPQGQAVSPRRQSWDGLAALPSDAPAGAEGPAAAAGPAGLDAPVRPAGLDAPAGADAPAGPAVPGPSEEVGLPTARAPAPVSLAGPGESG
jgi:RecB family exonuclease